MNHLTSRTIKYSLILLTFSSFTCCNSHQEAPPDPIQQVIRSMSDTFPQIALPEGTDPQDENWLGIDLEPKAPVLPLYPEAAAKKILLPPGYKIEAVLTEPQIEQPGAIAFDGNGRMYVLELRTYMLTADSEGTLDPVSRISRWEDKDADGIYETGTAFVDSLIFPRFVLPYGEDCILTMESDADHVYKYTDTDGDGKVDQKELFTTRYGRSGNVEHQQAFMYWGMDNWLYSTVNPFRIREPPQGIIREKTGYNRAQWGITHDDDGKLWFLGGASGLPSYFQFPIHYGNFKVEGEFAEGFDIPWGAPVLIEDMQGGMDQVRRPDGSLKRVTGAAGNDIYRGHRLPDELKGQLFYGEPVARIVRQVQPVVSEGLTTLHNVYQAEKSEFLRSTDPLFRPVDMATAPDGSLYIVDMYHGIIQEGQWAQKGSYLRTKIEQYQLDKVIGLGRIWRITYEGMERDKTPARMFEEEPAAWVNHLSHPNGWWRDKAQQLIVLHQDQTVIPQLEAMARSNAFLPARFHALWCLEGLQALTPDLITTLLQDPNPRMRIQAMRAGESLYKSGEHGLLKSYQALLSAPEPEVVIQAMLSEKHLEVPSLEEDVKKAMAGHTAKGVQLIGDQILHPPSGRGGLGTRKTANLTSSEKALIAKGESIFQELCSQCHGADGKGTLVGQGQLMAPPLTNSFRVQSHPNYTIKTLLHGLAGPIEGNTYMGGIMVGMKDQSDEWIASVTSYIRMYLENDADIVSMADVARVRAATDAREKPYQYEELIRSVPQMLVPKENWKVTASHTAPARIGGTASPLSAFNFEGWTTGAQQEEGMWFQIELPAPTTLTEVHFISPPISRGWRKGSPPPIQTFPRAYQIQLSMDGREWDQPVSSGACDEPENQIAFYPARARFLRITQMGTVDGEPIPAPWSMKELKIFGISEQENL